MNKDNELKIDVDIPEPDYEPRLYELEKEFAKAINRLSLEHFFADTPDWVLAGYAVSALSNLALTLTVLKDKANNKKEDGK